MRKTDKLVCCKARRGGGYKKQEIDVDEFQGFIG